MKSTREQGPTIPSDIFRDYGRAGATALRQALTDLPKGCYVTYPGNPERIKIIHDQHSTNLGKLVGDGKTYSFDHRGKEWQLILIPGKENNELAGQWFCGASTIARYHGHRPDEFGHTELHSASFVRGRDRRKTIPTRLRDPDSESWK